MEICTLRKNETREVETVMYWDSSCIMLPRYSGIPFPHHLQVFVLCRKTHLFLSPLPYTSGGHYGVAKAYKASGSLGDYR